MNSSKQRVQFMCPKCDQRLETLAKNAGRRARCTHCSAQMLIPQQPLEDSESAVLNPVPVRNPIVAPAKPENATVSLKIALPNNLGGMETNVTQSAADSVAKVVTGGVLVAVGAVLAMFFGGRKPSV